MKAIYWAILISFLLYGMNMMTGFGGEGNMEEEDSAYHLDDAPVSIDGELYSTVWDFRPNLEEKVDGAGAAIYVPAFFPEDEAAGDGMFYFTYAPETGVEVVGEWNNQRFSFRPEMDGFEEDYFEGLYVEEAAWYITSADLDGDEIAELLVALHDGVIDGVLGVYKPYELVESGGKKALRFQPKRIGTIPFQNNLFIDEKGHITAWIGSQGLYEEYALENGALKLIYSPNNP